MINYLTDFELCNLTRTCTNPPFNIVHFNFNKNGFLSIHCCSGVQHASAPSPTEEKPQNNKAAEYSHFFGDVI